MADGGQDVRQLAILGAGVVDVVGDDDREAERLGQRRRLRHEPVVVGQEMVRQLDEEAARGRAVASPEERRVAFRDGPRPGPVARPQATDQLPVAAARQRDETLGVLGEEGLAEPRDGLRAGHVGARHEPAQAPPADLRSGEQDEMRAADPLDDPAQVLLDRGAMTGQSGMRRPRTGGQALGRVGQRTVARSGRGRSPTTGPACRDDDPVRIRDGRVEQLDLETDDRVEPDRLGRRHETDRSVQPGVVRDGQPGQAQLDGPLDEVVGRRRTVEEREIRVAVEFGVRGLRHGSLRSEAADRGLASIEQSFYPDQPGVPCPTPDQIPIENDRIDETRTVGSASHRHARTDAPARLLRRPDRSHGRGRDAPDPWPPSRDPRGPGGQHVTDYQTSRRLGARDDSAALDCDGRDADLPIGLVSNPSGHRTPSLGVHRSQSRRLGATGT